MSNKARAPMTKPEEVIAWAEETKAGNGESFTMLKKEEQLLIARFILAMRDHIKALQSAREDAPQTPQSDERKPKEDKFAEDNGEVVGDEVKTSEKIILKQSNMEYFRANNVPMNRAFELYCVWRNCDPQNRTIFDDERKAWLKAASFAFWLNLPHE